jgi:hypothetical protein
MTEAEWLACDDPRLMLKYLWLKVSDRKLRLFACACCRRVWSRLTDELAREAVEVAERYADGRATAAELRGIRDRAIPVLDENALRASFDTLHRDRRFAFSAAVFAVGDRAGGAFNAALFAVPAIAGADEGERTVQCNLLRDIFGNPFRPMNVDPDWLTPTVTSLATAAYEERELPSGHLDAARLGVLADALEDAGCDNAEMLGHLRGLGWHVRGCWALDLLLGKE